LSRRLLDVFIRFTLVIALVVLCYQVFSPFLSLMAWALILAVTLYPAHQMLAGRRRGRQGLSATLLVLAGLVLIVAPTALLLASLGDSVHQLVAGVRDNTLHVPAPPASVSEWPVVGRRCSRCGRRRIRICRP
jgi:predicted PurR-regulated permease PerM